ncbi:MAG: hypothetical protein H0X38_09210, partial [Planctomycetes bacterium]|nr:hypothetical protein [Planctomycetota bacterium]
MPPLALLLSGPVIGAWLLSSVALGAADAAAPTIATVDPLVAVPIPAEGILDQHLREGTDNACVPATLLNALRCGPPAWQTVWRDLPGGDARGRLNG